MYSCACRNGKIITIITKNYLSTNIEEKRARGKKSRHRRQAADTDMRDASDKKIRLPQKKTLAQNAVIKFVCIIIVVFCCICSFFIRTNISASDRTAEQIQLQLQRYRYNVASN